MANNKTFRISKLEAHHTSALSALSSSRQPLATVAAAYGATQDVAEKHLSVLIDGGLATRTRGDRAHATHAQI